MTDNTPDFPERPPDWPESLSEARGYLPREPRELGEDEPDGEFPDFETVRKVRPRDREAR